MKKNINTKEYWNNRFASGDWEIKKGRNQTQEFALSQVTQFNILGNFSGTILDFGCGLGDAFPIYRKNFPNAKLIGLDISNAAIDKCKEKYGELAEFLSGDYTMVPKVDIIIASNVFEHLSNDKIIAKHLISKCSQLFVIVPYAEKLIPECEHINTYDTNYFKEIGEYEFKIFPSKGWSLYGFNLFYHVYFKNIFRPFLGKPFAKRAKQIIYIFRNEDAL